MFDNLLDKARNLYVVAITPDKVSINSGDGRYRSFRKIIADHFAKIGDLDGLGRMAELDVVYIIIYSTEVKGNHIYFMPLLKIQNVGSEKTIDDERFMTRLCNSLEINSGCSEFFPETLNKE